jgi:hypothetical protein
MSLDHEPTARPAVAPKGRWSEYTQLSRQIKQAGLLDRRRGWYQIEHHLFPNMPRPNLRHAQPLVRAFCQQHGLPYTEASLFASYAQAVRHLHAVGAPLRPAVVE